VHRPELLRYQPAVLEKPALRRIPGLFPEIEWLKPGLSEQFVW
jgi:hypothetical protein